MNGSRRWMAALLAALTMLATAQALSAPMASAQTFVPISGSGSTWSFNALDQWRRTVDVQLGIAVQFAANGSSQGRAEFATQQVDFAVSDVEYGLSDGGIVEPPPALPFAYLPIVAGGTAFMYNLEVDGRRVTNLRLSGEVVAGIFTRQITTWGDARIAADNPALDLPDRPIVPVVRADGSGSTAQFTRWLASKHGSIWDSYCGRPACGATSNFPVTSGFEAKNGSQGVAGFVAQNSSEGSITYVEYSYARNASFPVAKVLNDGGYYVGPTAATVSVALTSAATRPDLTPDLDPVYRSTDPRAYPLSGYSLMIVPIDVNARFTAEKGRSLSEFAYVALCEGQQQADALGYAPLPVNLVRAAVAQVGRIPGSTGRLGPDNLVGCDNPTFSPDGSNLLATTAPQPAACDRPGPVQCGSDGTPPGPTPIATSTPVPTAVPSPAPTPRPTASPGPRPRPAFSLGNHIRRALAQLRRAFERFISHHPPGRGFR